MVTIPGRPTANPSRLKVTAEVPPLAWKVSVLVKAFWTRNTGWPASQVPSPAGSEQTTQPFCQLLPVPQPGVAAVPLNTQTTTVWPSLMASARANCISPIRPLTSPEMRFAVVTYWNDGMPTIIRIVTMAMTITTSSMVKPELYRPPGCMFSAVRMTARLRRQACARLANGRCGPSTAGTAGCFTQRHGLCRHRKANAHARSPTLRRHANAEVRVVSPGDLIHDRQTQPAARPGRAGQAVEALAHAQSCRLFNAGTVVLDFEKRVPLLDAAAHRDVPAGRCVFKSVVDQITQQVLQQPGIAGHLRGLCLGAEVQARTHRAIDVALDQMLDQRLERHRLEALAQRRHRFRPGQSQQLIGRVRQLLHAAINGRELALHGAGRG